ncbi:tRNA pseudouridine(55) synthase TruB [Ruminiclostridium herbifermentans]|uniref:tRNA pseudouridine synthase B n=1 Tax=Ruminiclostridium herbifermentans TaxID=2488810 RepID=A0A4U7JDX5_9FIRM|nr:tRNA pseudouridine(55) synthase TruB [Ruminiclostridium herbifermentans]QNU65733.1 tRNA pseudouridine(55) synthase TruB [Ruminiclostridium herbifermentans]
MNGILNVLKPAGMTSFDVIAVARKITQQRKIGHTGTLDPSAVGVLPICLGNATKAIEFMIDKDKVYRAEMTLGVTTDTQDSSGKVISSHPVDVTNNEIVDVCKSFIGEIAQLPPMYSAIKIGGKKLYEIARQGETIERQARNITIYDINVIRIWDDISIFGENSSTVQYATKKVLFDVHCSKGTYIRTLCNDIGEKLGCGGHMSFLVRTRAGNYDINSAFTLEEIMELAKENTLSSKLVPVESVFRDYDKVQLNEADTAKYNNGVWIKYTYEKENKNVNKRVYDFKGVFLGIGEVFDDGRGTFLKSKKFFRG